MAKTEIMKNRSKKYTVGRESRRESIQLKMAIHQWPHQPDNTWEKWQKNPHIQVSRACRIISRKSLGSDCCQKCWNWARAEWPEYLWQYDYFSFSFVLRWLNKSQIPLSLEDTEYRLTDFFSADTDLILLINVMTYYYSNENLRNVFVLKAKNVFIIYNIKFIWNERCYQWPSIPFSNSAVLWIMHNLNMKTVPS